MPFIELHLHVKYFSTFVRQLVLNSSKPVLSSSFLADLRQ